MEKQSVWKRFGGWLKGNQYAKVGEEVNNVDAEGLVIDGTGQQPQIDDDLSLAKSAKKPKPLAAIEDGFNRLTDVIREMNENVTMHREQAADLNRKVTQLAEVLPEGLSRQNKSLADLAEFMKIQAIRQEQIAELMKSLPEDSRKQLEQLSDISSNVQKSLENQNDQVEAFSEFNESVRSVNEHSQAQAASLANIGQMLEENEKHLQEMISDQNSRFSKLFVTTIVMAVAAMGCVVAVLALASKMSQ